MYKEKQFLVIEQKYGGEYDFHIKIGKMEINKKQNQSNINLSKAK